ncbi:MAG: hypothetical protein V3R27_08775 [Pseudomonadales bacterium]
MSMSACSGCAVGCRTRQRGESKEFDRRGLTLAAALCFGLPLLALLAGARVAEALFPELPGAVVLGLVVVMGMISRLTPQVEAWLTPKSPN